ncbi:uroporphyrinogen decarboxylase family protein [candidate division KSB1 bacterium]|nr:uroporphyrinogen decarboxylase family protein [candidate division KSB1 bacterium]
MNSMSRFKNRLNGRRVDRVPNFNIFMTYAAHYIRQPLSRYYLDYRVLCDANFAVLEAFQLDVVQAISDPYREAADTGAEIDFPHDGLPISKKPFIEELSDLKKIKFPQPADGARMTDRLNAIRLFCERVGGEVPVMGWVEGALAEAADLRGVQNIMMDMYDQPEWLMELLEKCCEMEMAFAQAQVRAGADIIGLGDAVASQVGPAAYRRYALPYEKRIFDAVKKTGAIGRLHICGNTSGILPDMAQSGAEIIDVDWMVDMKAACEAFGDHAAVCGNQDPAAIMLRGTPETVKKAVRDCVKNGGDRCFSAAGCEIPDNTPAENLLAQAEVLGDM